jgi:hypothetical protein
MLLRLAAGGQEMSTNCHLSFTGIFTFECYAEVVT